MNYRYNRLMVILAAAITLTGSAAAMHVDPQSTTHSTQVLADQEGEFAPEAPSLLDATCLVHQVHDDCFASEMSPGELAGAASSAIAKLEGIEEALTGARAGLEHDESHDADEQRSVIEISLLSVAEKKAQLVAIVEAIEHGTFNAAMIAHHRSFASHLHERKWSLVSSALMLGVMIKFAEISLGTLWLPAALSGVIGGGIKMLLTRRAGGTWCGACKTGAAEFFSSAGIGAATAGFVEPSVSALPLPKVCSGVASGMVAGGTASLLRDAGSRKVWRDRMQSAAFSGALGGVVAGVFELSVWLVALRGEAASATSSEELSLLEDEIATVPGQISAAMQAVSTAQQSFASSASQGAAHVCSGDVCSLAVRSAFTQGASGGAATAAQQLASAQNLLVGLQEEQREIAAIVVEKKEKAHAQPSRIEQFKRWLLASLMPDVPQVTVDAAYRAGVSC